MMAAYIRLGSFNRGMAPDAWPEPNETIVPVDRTNPVLGNRHVLRNTADVLARDQVIDAYRRDLDADIAAGGPMSRAVRELADRVLRGERLVAMCHCLPRRCHGEAIVDRVRELCARAQESEDRA